MKEDIEFIFSNLRFWLEFSEKKNAALLTLNLALLFGINKLELFNKVVAWDIYSYLSSFLLLISSIILFISFIPRIKMPWLLSTNRKNIKHNSIFWGDLVKYDVSSYMNTFYNKQPGDCSKYKIGRAHV